MPVVEIASWVVPDSYLEDPTVVRQPFETVRKADGCLGLYYGLTEEDAKRLYLFIVWETLEHHTAFTKLPVFAEAVKIIKTTQADILSFYHVEFNHDFTPSLIAPTTEVLPISLKEGVSKEQLYDVFEEIAAQVNPANAKHAPVTWGQTIEDPSKFLMTIGWDSTKIHTDFVSQDLFQPVLKKLMSAATPKMFHITSPVKL